MERYVAFDIGDRRIGVAISDPFNTYALPSQTYFRKGFKEDVEAIAQIASSKGATVIICGLPVNFDGTEAVQTEKTRRFIDALKKKTAIPVICEDERFTTKMAHETLISEGMRREKRKNYVDALAAANILDGYLSKLKK
ncbi:MAG: Holliday junction resolvase RuvX [Clostridia bacterium]|nr:Holliday junction resolvase RuvX [Clostridia bacterium]